MTIKEYADKHGKSVQSVYKQMKSKENAKRLEGHILLRKVGNKNIQVLDEVAIAILEEASTQAPQVIVQMEDKEQIASLQEENKKLLLKLTEVQEALIKAKEQTLLAEQQKLLLEDKERQLQAKDEELRQLQNKTKKLEENCSYYEQVAEEQAKSLDEAKQLENDMATELEEIKQMNVWQFIKYRKKGNT